MFEIIAQKSDFVLAHEMLEIEELFISALC